MKIKYNTIKLVFAALLFFIAGCSKFDEINTNPDTTTHVPASMLCTNVILSALSPGGQAMGFISQNALPKYVGFTILGPVGAQYNNTGSGSFGSMTILPNIDGMLEMAKGSNMENSYKGIAAFAKAAVFYRMTMWMGDLPYTDAGKGGEGILDPAYDTQESVLIAILDELKAADEYFKLGVAFDGDPTPLRGDPVKWRKSVNAFTLKVLISLSTKENTASLDIKNRFSDIVEEGVLMDAGITYLGCEYTNLNKHPLSASVMFVPKTIVSSIVVDNLKLLNDKRLFYYCDPSLDLILEGYEASEPGAYRGVDVSMDYEQMNNDYKANKFSQINSRYQKEDACEPQMFVTYAEQQLILAEATVKGWISGMSAKDYYESGVKAALKIAMAMNGDYAHGNAIDQSYIDGYFTGEASFKSSAEDQLKQIWMQEYLLRFMQDGDYSYFEYRRNKYPEFPINPESSMNVNKTDAIPMRCLYPGSEMNYNRPNLIDALVRQYDGYDEINKLMWLYK